MKNLDTISIKYFKLCVDTNSIKKDTPQEISANCPLCGDKKHRLHIYRPDGFDQDITHCFNEGCVLSDKHHNMYNFLKIVKPELLDSYKKENTKNLIKNFKYIKDDSQSILEKIEKNTGIKSVNENKKNLEIPLDNFFMKCKESEKCVNYLKQRNIIPEDDWYFSEEKFFAYNNKKVFLENYLIIPIYSDNKYKGFYSRSIYKKEFSTFLLPDTEKIWISNHEVTPGDFYLFEGVFDAMSTPFKNKGAMLGASISKEYLDELKNNDVNIIFCLDNDSTGVKKSLKYVKEGYSVFIWPKEWNYKDINEVLVSGINIYDIGKTIKNNVFSGIIAEVKLRMGYEGDI